MYLVNRSTYTPGIPNLWSSCSGGRWSLLCWESFLRSFGFLHTWLSKMRTRRKQTTSDVHEIRDTQLLKPNIMKPKSKLAHPPLPSIFSSCFDEVPTLSYQFFQIDALDLAPRLLGKFIRRDDVVLQITEVEAYRPNDSACHGRFGVTARTAPVFGSGGHAYVYLCYGMHSMLNVVADKKGSGAAVLIRSCAPVAGLDTIQKRRGQKTDKPILLTGPGKVGQALGISTQWSCHPLYLPGGLELLEGPEPEEVLVGPRVGIEYAMPEDVNALWRFAIAGSPWISAPKHTLKKAL